MHKKWHLTFIKHEMQIKFINFCNLTIQNTFRHFNTVCQQKGPLAKHENRKFPKPFQGCLGMLVGPTSAQSFGFGRTGWPIRPILSAIFGYFSNFGLQKNLIKCSVLTTFMHLGGQLGS